MYRVFQKKYIILKLNFVARKISVLPMLLFSILDTCLNNLLTILSVLVAWQEMTTIYSAKLISDLIKHKYKSISTKIIHNKIAVRWKSVL